MSAQPTPYLFGRRYLLTINTTDGKTITVSSDELGLNPLKFTFECQTSAMADMWTATFEIYNLNYQTTGTVINQGSTITLSAGYLAGQNYGVIWTGKVLWCEFAKRNVTDHVLVVQSLVGGDLINGMVNLATGPFQTQRQIITAMAKAANLTIKDPGGMLNSTDQLPCPVVLFGQPRHYIRQAARKANTWGFPDFAGNINILQLTAQTPTVTPTAGSSTSNTVDFGLESTPVPAAPQPEIIYSVPIAAGSSLTPDPTISYSIIGTPKQTLIADVQWGVAFKVLCDSRLQVKNPPMLIKIDVSAVIEQVPVSFGAPPPVLSQSGIYAVVAVGNYGDSRGNEWYTEVLALGTSGTMIGFPSSEGKDNRYINTQQGGN